MLILLDASIYIFRYYFSLPPRWQSNDGRPTEAVYGYLLFLIRLLEELRPDHIAAAYDASLDSCFRNHIYPAYKANRALPDEALAFQLSRCAEGAELLGIPCFSSSRYEADDIIGTLAARWRKQQQKRIAIVSRDKDLGQLLKKNECLWDYGFSDPEFPADLQRRLGVEPAQIPDYLALAGDAVDNIPGAPGVGRKTALALLSEYRTVEEVLDAGVDVAGIPVRGAVKLPEILAANAEQINLSKQLATVFCEVPLGDPQQSVEQLVRRVPADPDAFAVFAEQLGLGGDLVERVNRLNQSEGNKP